MKKILLLSQFFYPDKTGTGKILSDLFFALDKKNFSVDVIASQQEYNTKINKILPEKEEIENVRIFRCFHWFLSKNNVFGRIYTYIMVFLCTCFTCFRYSLARDKDLVVAVSNPPIMPLLAAFLRNKKRKAIYIVHDLYPDIAIAMGIVDNRHIFSRVMFLINRYVFQKMDVIVVLGRDMKRHLLKAYNVPENKLVILTNWAEASLVVEEREKRNVFRILYTGNMGRFHNLDIAIEAVRSMQDVELFFIGEGVAKPSLIEKANKIENVKFYSFLEEVAYKKMLLSSDALLVSLEKSLSGLAVPSKFYTYLAAGRPIICISDEDTEMAMTIKENKCGFIVGHGSVEAFRAAIKVMQGSYQVQVDMGSAAKQVFVQKYQKDDIVVCYEKLFSEICTEKMI